MDKLLVFVVFLTLMILGINCQNKKNKVINEHFIGKLTMPELLKIAYISREETDFILICNLISDSVLRSEEKYRLHCVNSLNYIDNVVDFEFINTETPKISDDYLYDIYIKDENTIIIESKPSNLNQLQDKAKEYIFDIYNTKKYLTKFKDSIDYFGNVELSNVNAYIHSDIKQKKGLNNEEWKIIFKCFHELKFFFDKRRDNIALEKWGLTFSALSFEKQVAVAELIPYSIIISLD